MRTPFTEPLPTCSRKAEIENAAGEDADDSEDNCDDDGDSGLQGQI